MMVKYFGWARLLLLDGGCGSEFCAPGRADRRASEVLPRLLSLSLFGCGWRVGGVRCGGEVEPRPRLPHPPPRDGCRALASPMHCGSVPSSSVAFERLLCACACVYAQPAHPDVGAHKHRSAILGFVHAGSLVDARPDALLLLLLAVVGSLPWEGVALRLCTGDDAAQFAFVHPKSHVAVPDTLPGASTRASVTFEAPATARAQPYVRRYRLTAPDGGFDCASVVSPALSRILLKWIVRYCCGALRAIRHRVRSLGRH